MKGLTHFGKLSSSVFVTHLAEVLGNTAVSYRRINAITWKLKKLFVSV